MNPDLLVKALSNVNVLGWFHAHSGHSFIPASLLSLGEQREGNTP